MQAFFTKLLVGVVTALLAKLLEKIHTEKVIWNEKSDIDERLKAFKEAYKESFNGEPITPEQKEKLRVAIRGFIVGGPNGGL